MGWFSPLKGVYPGLAQIDKTLSVGVGETGIVRGSLMYVDASYNTGDGGVFRLADEGRATDPAAYLYFALVGQDDFQAGMAGSIGQGNAQVGDENGVFTAGAARVTGLAVGMPMEFQTDQFTGQLVTGDYLTCGADGKLVKHTAGDNVVAQVTASAFNRWVNDAVAIEGRRTGASVSVINARSVWIPTFGA